MKKEQCFELGFITKTHGLNGEVILFFDVDDVSPYTEIETVMVELKGTLVPYFIDHLLPHKDRFICKFEDVDTVDVAKTLVGNPLFLPVSQLPALDHEKGQFYYHEVIGYTIEDVNNGLLGTISFIHASTAQPLISMDYLGKEVLIPVSDETVLLADHTQKRLKVCMPEGLLEVYLTDQEAEKDDD